MPTEDAYSSGHLVLSHFGTCMCSNVETNLSWTCLVSGLLNFEHPSVLLFCFIFQLLGECHCWWTKESPRARVAKFYGRLWFNRSVLRASKFSGLKLTEIVIFWVYYTIPFGFSLIRHFLDITFKLLLLCLAKDHWWGFITRIEHMVHIVN